MNENISKLEIAIQSPTFWAIVGLAAYNVLAYLAPGLTGPLQDAVNIVLMVLAMYLHPQEVQKAGNVQ